MSQNAEQRYLNEVAISLRREGVEVGEVANGWLDVKWAGNLLCQINGSGNVVFRKEDCECSEMDAALSKVIEIAANTAAYMQLMEKAPYLQATDLEDRYKLLADFNGIVLAGQYTSQGVQFVTWSWDHAQTGVCWGHYFGADYNAVKQDFAVRAGLVEQDRLFTDRQLAEVYRCVGETMENAYQLTEERQKLLEGVSGQIRNSVADLDELVYMSNQKEMEAETEPEPQQGGLLHT